MSTDKHLIERVARALHEAMRHSPAFSPMPSIRGSWDALTNTERSEYRAVTHSALVAAGTEEVWVVTDESNHSEDDRKMSSVVVVADSREAALTHLADNYGGVEECVWQDQDGNGWWFTTMYGEYPWTMQKQTIERSDSRAVGRVEQ